MGERELSTPVVRRGDTFGFSGPGSENVLRNAGTAVSGWALALLILLASPAATEAQTRFYLQDGDRVVFYGDSITEQGFYTSYVEDYVATRFPLWNVTFINSGWAGDWVEGGGGGTAEKRVLRDVLANDPSVVTIMLGMNDGGYQAFDPAFYEAYSKGYRQLLSFLQGKQPGPRITLIEPSPYDEISRAPRFPGYNGTLIRYGQFLRELGREKGLSDVDFNAPLVGVIEGARQIDPDEARKLIPDEIHPSPEAGLLLAAALMKAWNGPSLVSAVELDAGKRRVVRAENAVVSKVNSEGTLSWSQQDGALPLPVDSDDPLMMLVLRSSEIVQQMDRQTLKVTGLATARYTLKIDGESAGVWTAEQLTQGIELSRVPTPMLRQSLAVHAVTRRLRILRMARWQGVQVALEDEKSRLIQQSLAGLDAFESELLSERHALAQPREHKYELVQEENRAATS